MLREASTERHPAQQVHGAPERARADSRRGVDRIDEHLRRRHPRPDQRRPLGPEPDVAEQFQAYWELLSADPGAPRRRRAGDGGQGEEASSRTAVEAILATVPTSLADVPRASRRCSVRGRGSAVLDTYIEMVDAAETFSCITLAFGVNKTFKDALKDNSHKSHAPLPAAREGGRAQSDGASVRSCGSRPQNNVYEAFGAFIDDPLYQWARETNTRALDLNTHVSVHPLEVPAEGSARRRSDRRHGFGQLQRCVDERQRREHADDPRRPARGRHLLHRVQPPVQPLLLPLGAGADQEDPERRREEDRTRSRCSSTRPTAG